MERYPTTGKVARRLGVSPERVRSLARRGELPTLRYAGGWLRFSEADVDALIERGSEEGTTCRSRSAR